MKKDWSIKRSLLILAAIGFFSYIAYAVDYSKKQPVTNSPPVIQEVIEPGALVAKINAQRKVANLTEYGYITELNSSAQAKCADMVAGNYYEHINPRTGKHGYDYIPEFYSNANHISENLNKGKFNNNQQVIDSWMGSEAHKAAILSAEYVDTGLAVCESAADGETIIVEHFADKKAPEPYIPPEPDYSAACCDGAHSFSTGRGTCSHHDGVCEWL